MSILIVEVSMLLPGPQGLFLQESGPLWSWVDLKEEDSKARTVHGIWDLFMS